MGGRSDIDCIRLQVEGPAAQSAGSTEPVVIALQFFEGRAMKISDLRMGVKLGLGFFVVVSLTLLLGAIALVQMSRLHDNA